jgi:hypothetical protein
MVVYHVSEEPNIGLFEPRRSLTADEPLVWAIDDEHLHNYLVPRDCPRVTFYAGSTTTVADRQRFLSDARAVVAIESRWLERVRSCRLFCYGFPSDTFALHDEAAGYFVSRVAVTPVSTFCIDDPMAALCGRGVELRVLPDLSPLREAVIASTLKFSIIRWRNASPQKTSSPL